MPTTPAYVADPIPPLDPTRAATLAERAHRILDGGTPRPDSKYQRRELVLHAISAYQAQQEQVQFRNAQALQTDFITRNKLEKEWYFDAMRAESEFGGTTDQYLVSFVLPTHTNPVNDRDYVELPQEFLNVRPYQNLWGEGVQAVLPLKEADRRRYRFVEIQGGKDDLLSSLFKGGLGGQFTYSRRGNLVLLKGDHGVQRVAERFPALELLLVIRTRPTDELPGPALLQDAQDFDILARLLKLAQKIAVEDKTNDSNAVAP